MLNKQGDNIQSCCTPFQIFNQSVVPSKLLTVASWPTCRFVRRQVRWPWYGYSFVFTLSLLYIWGMDFALSCKVRKVIEFENTFWKREREVDCVCVKCHRLKLLFFLVVMYGCESWTIRKTEDRWIDASKLWCWQRLLRVPWTERRSKSVLNIHWKDWCWSWSSNTLATWCKDLTHWKKPWCWERWKAGEGNDRGRDGWMASPTQWTRVWANSRRWWRIGKPGFHGLA